MTVDAGFHGESQYPLSATSQTRQRHPAANNMTTTRRTSRRGLGTEEVGRSRSLRLGTEDGRRSRRENPEFAVQIPSNEPSAAGLGRPTPHREAPLGVAHAAAYSRQYLIPGRPSARTEYDETRRRELHDEPISSGRALEGCKAAKSLVKVMEAGDKYFEIQKQLSQSRTCKQAQRTKRGSKLV